MSLWAWLVIGATQWLTVVCIVPKETQAGYPKRQWIASTMLAVVAWPLLSILLIHRLIKG